MEGLTLTLYHRSIMIHPRSYGTSIPNTPRPPLKTPIVKNPPSPIPPPLLLPSTLPHRRRPNRPALLLRPRIPERIPEIPPLRLHRPPRPSRLTRRPSAARILHEAIEALRGAFGARLDGLGGLGGGEAGGGREVGFCYLRAALGPASPALIKFNRLGGRRGLPTF